MKNIAVSISKFEDGVINEDAVIATEKMIAVSDGAGGGGVYAERWSSYLVNHLPEVPIKSFDELDGWIEDIWETFYNDCEESAKQEGGMLLDKFYDEGSFATLAVIWRENNEWTSFSQMCPLFTTCWILFTQVYRFIQKCPQNIHPLLI